jgi:hypothetical protein
LALRAMTHSLKRRLAGRLRARCRRRSHSAVRPISRLGNRRLRSAIHSGLINL